MGPTEAGRGELMEELPRAAGKPQARGAFAHRVGRLFWKSSRALSSLLLRHCQSANTRRKPQDVGKGTGSLDARRALQEAGAPWHSTVRVTTGP